MRQIPVKLVGLAILAYAAGRAAASKAHTRAQARHWQWVGTKWALILTGLAVIVTVAASRWRRRNDHRARIAAAMGGVLGKKHVEPVTIERARFHKGQLTEVVASHGHHVNSLDRSMRKEMGEVMAAHFNSPVEVEWEPHHSAVRVRRAQPEPPDMSPTGRVRTAVRLAIGNGAQVSDVVYDQDGQTPVGFKVTYPATAGDADTGWRTKADAVIAAKTGQAWLSSWEPDNDRVTYRARPTLPAFAAHRADLLPGSAALPYAIGASGKVMAWDPNAGTPHALVMGTTGAGKTVLLRTLVTEAVRRDYQVACADPKRISLVGLRRWPGVLEVATSTQAMVDLVHGAYLEVDSRFDRLEHGLIEPDDLQPRLYVVDELHEFIDRANAAWKGPGKEHSVVEELRSVARLGREGRVHLLVGIQRADAAIIGGANRDNYRLRIGVGPLSRQARDMIGASDSAVEPDPPLGRAVVVTGQDGGQPAQVFWTPNPAAVRSMSDEDRAILDGLRPTVEQVPPPPDLRLVPDTATAEGEDAPAGA